MPTKLQPFPTLVIYQKSGQHQGEEIARVAGISEQDRVWFIRDLNAALGEKLGVAGEYVDAHVEAAPAYAKPIGTGPLPGVEIRAFARSIADAVHEVFRWEFAA